MNKAELGRSMVEMLGVLAIIGVLSIGSLISYDYAKERAKAAATIDIASKLLAIARVKGKAVTTLSEKMDYTVRDNQLIARAEIVGKKGNVIRCGCALQSDDSWDSYVDRVIQTSGLTESDISTGIVPPENFNNRLGCPDGSVVSCYQMSFPS